jgi:hypothetical protein
MACYVRVRGPDVKRLFRNCLLRKHLLRNGLIGKKLGVYIIHKATGGKRSTSEFEDLTKRDFLFNADDRKWRLLFY